MKDVFEAAVEQHQRRVFTLAVYLLSSRNDAEDITQEVFVRLWHNPRLLSSDGLGAWLLRVTRNACYDRLRRRRVARGVFAQSPEGAAAEVPTRDPGPEARAGAHQIGRRLRRALAELDEPYRSVVVLREIEGLSYREIAEVLETPLNTIRVQLHRARSLLREQLREVYHHAATG